MFFIKAIAAVVMSGSTFTMCAGGPVPVGCCEPGDRLDVIHTTYGDCDDMGGIMVGDPANGGVCTDVDF